MISRYKLQQERMRKDREFRKFLRRLYNRIHKALRLRGRLVV